MEERVIPSTCWRTANFEKGCDDNDERYYSLVVLGTGPLLIGGGATYSSFSWKFPPHSYPFLSKNTGYLGSSP